MHFNIENVISNESISELVWKLPINNDDLVAQEVIIPFYIKEKDYMKQILDEIKIFIDIEKINKQDYYFLEPSDLKNEE